MWIWFVWHAAAGEHLDALCRRLAARTRRPDQIFALGLASLLNCVADEAAADHQDEDCRTARLIG